MGLINSREPMCQYKLNSAASHAWRNLTGCGPEHAVPIENFGDRGTVCSHFEEACLRTELMTGFIRSIELPLSIITVGAMEDLGYTVDYTAADNFTNFACACESATPNNNNVRRRSLRNDSGYEFALRYGMEYLQNQTITVVDESTRLVENEDGVEFCGDEYVSIIYLDDFGEMRHLEVTADML